MRFNVPKLGEEEVRPAVPYLAPGIGLRDESRGHGIDGLEGFEFTLVYLASSVAEIGHNLGGSVISVDMRPSGDKS